MDKVHSMSKDEFKKIENNLLDLDSEFRFKCRKCGKCCTHQHTILFNTRDIFMIAKKLEKTPQEVINEYAEVYITQGSYVPVVHMVPRGKQEVCPFLENNRCTIHDSKPTVCALYPPGRVFVGDKLREIREGKVRYILNNVFCDSQKQTHTVREWLERFNISEEDEFFLLWSKTIYELSAALRQMMERGTSEKKMRTLWDIVYTELYLRYDTGEEFMPQFRAATNRIFVLSGIIDQYVEDWDQQH